MKPKHLDMDFEKNVAMVDVNATSTHVMKEQANL
jgi:hypothetical protein